MKYKVGDIVEIIDNGERSGKTVGTYGKIIIIGNFSEKYCYLVQRFDKKPFTMFPYFSEDELKPYDDGGWEDITDEIKL